MGLNSATEQDREGGSRPRGLLGVTIALAFTAVVLAGCSAVRLVRPWSPSVAPTSEETRAQAITPHEWVGKTLPELTARLGQPTSVQPLLETTGQLVIYARPGAPHYVFETGSNGKIVSASAD